ncbi:heme A synthase [Nakamurella flava]|uniref:Heme A synthase n=1 Tax=Nakamurella flava TaxID=2576308 RepID=A0A4U6QL82_9ACTN|nr:COX15/CtaA family protein [Nakamurella flava]TKV60902.1 heme A synthase [Nakamurella flava]
MAVIPTSPATDTAPSTGRSRWTPSLRLQRAFAWAAAVTNGGIAVTGATVRVTGSGLGCPTWPECHEGSFVPIQREDLSAFHQAIEFGNRTLTGVVLIASLGTFLLVWLARPRRTPVVWLALAGPVGVVFQAVWGGIVVLTGLSWWTVAPHFLVSLLLLFFAIAVLTRLYETDAPPRWVVPRPLVGLTWATVVVLGALCVAGTLVTAAGPHGGDDRTPRLDVPVRALAQVHADLMFAYLGLLVATTVAFLAVKAPARLVRRAWILVAVTAGQGLIGLVQYATGVPEALVVAHVLGAVLLTAAAAAVVFALRVREPQQS